jgi:WD40 repeat protein
MKRLALVFLLLASVVALRAQQKVPRFEVDPSFPQLPAGKVLGDMSSVTVDAQDHVWMIHRPLTVPAAQRANAAPPVLEFDASGKYIAGWGGPGTGFEWPEREHGIFADPTGAIWVSGNNGWAAAGAAPPPGKSDDMLLKFTPAGRFLMQIGHSGASTGDTDHANVKQAADMTRFKDELFVADGYGNHRVVVFDANDGTFKRTWGAHGGPPFNIAHAIKVSNDGLVYLADRENKRLQVFTTAGEFRQQVIIGGDGVTRSAAGLAFSPDRAQQYLYVADINNKIHILDRKSLKTLDSFGKGGTAPGEFGTVHEIAADSKGNLYTAELRTHRVQKFAFKGIS